MLFFISIFLPPLPILKLGSTQANESATKILKPTKIYVRKQRRKYTHFNCHVVSPTRLKEKLVLKFLFRFFQFVFFSPILALDVPNFPPLQRQKGNNERIYDGPNQRTLRLFAENEKKCLHSLFFLSLSQKKSFLVNIGETKQECYYQRFSFRHNNITKI